MQTVGLPDPQPTIASKEIDAELDYSRSRLPFLQHSAEAMYSIMNVQQAQIFNDIYNALQTDHPVHFFIEGKPGRGKMFLINALTNTLRAHDCIVLICGTSGLAATLYTHG